MRHRIFTELEEDGSRLWRVQIAGHDAPINEAALSHAGALELLEHRLEVNEWWRAATEEPRPEEPVYLGGPPGVGIAVPGHVARALEELEPARRVLVAAPPEGTQWWRRFLP